MESLVNNLIPLKSMILKLKLFILLVILAASANSTFAANPTVTVTAPTSPSNSSALIFNVVFSESVTGFTNDTSTDLLISSTAGGTISAAVSGTGTTYTVTLTGMNGTGNISLTIRANAAQNGTAEGNLVSNLATVSFDDVPPTVTINQSGSQSDPTNNTTVQFTAVFSEAVTNFTNTDITIGGTAGATTVAVSTTDNITWTVNISGMTNDGTVTATIPANAAQDAAGNLSGLSTSTDNSITVDITRPTVTINQGGSQPDPTNAALVSFTAIFSEAISGFTNSDVSISGTAGATTAVVSTADNITWTVNISGMTGDGTIIVTIPANAAQDGTGNNNFVSTSTDNSVSYDATPPSVSGSFSPADDATGVTTSTSFTINFNENIKISTTGSVSGSQDLIEFYKGGSFQYSISRADVGGVISISGSQATFTLNSELDVNTSYNIRIGSKVFSDMVGNDYPGFSSNSTWNFTTSSGVSINNLTSSKCAGPFTSLSSITISEDAANNIQGFDNGSRTMILGFDSPGFIFDPNSSPTISFTPGRDIQSISGIAVNFNSVSFTVNFANVSNDNQARNDIDAITISGLKVSYDGTSSTPIHIVKTGGTISIQGITNNTTSLATLTSGTPSVAPTLVTSDLTYCQGENISATTITATNITGATYRWYSDAALSTLSGTGNPINVVSGLGISSATAQDFTRYLTITESGKCESSALLIAIKVASLPGVNAGADQTVANGNTAVCSGEQITLGGTPTLTTLPISGSYTYSWSSNPSLSISATANPVVSIINNTGNNVSYVVNLTVTDPNGCIGTDTKNIDVKTSIIPQLTQPNSTVFSTNTAPLELRANPDGGVFTGIGVIQTGVSAYKFSAASAYDNTQPLPQNYPIKYTVTSNGCTITDYPIVTFILSNQLFTEIASQYCSSENPIAESASFIQGGTSSQYVLKANVNSLATITNSVNNWNNSTRFFYAQNLGSTWRGAWTAGIVYNSGDYVRDGNEIYVSITSLNIGNIPSTSPASWQLTNLLKVSFNGAIRNYYEGSYGGNASGKTIVKKTSTYTVSSQTYNYYELLTNINYNQCATCDYAYPAFYMEFQNPSHLSIMVRWVSGNYYYPNDIVSYNGNYYKQILTYNSNPYWTQGAQPDLNPSIWQNVGSTFDTGYIFSESGATGVFATGQFVTINRTPTLLFGGLNSGLVNATEFCTDNKGYVLTGVVTGLAGDITGAGNFDMSYDNVTFNTKPGLSNSVPSPGQATFNPLTSYNGNSSVNAVKTFYVRYTYDPGTKGSTNQACLGSTVQNINVNLSPTVNFTTAPPDNKLFCPSDPAVNLEASAVSTSSASITFTGPGVSDQGGGKAKFDPATGITTLQNINNTTYDYTNRPISYPYIIAKATDTNGCSGEITKPLTVNPVPPASLTAFTPNVCYTTSPFLIDGGQSNAFYTITYKDVAKTISIGSTSSPQPDFTFNPKQIFDDAVSIGANELATLSYELVYTTFDPDLCKRSLPPITIKVAPRIPVRIAGITDGEEFCSNISPTKVIELSPTGGTLEIWRNGVQIVTPPIVDGKLQFNNIPLAGGDYDLRYDVITGNGCSNPTDVSVRVFPSPVASFTAPPKCEGDLINFTADGTLNNNATPTYTWTLEGQPIIGQSINYKFSSTGTYTVNLNVTYPATGVTNTVCASQASLDQFIGLIPKVDFTIVDVCKGDATKFEYSDQVTTISQAKWNFGDAFSLGYGSVTQPVNTPGISGTYGEPIHQYANQGPYTVTLTGRTSPQTGSCESSITKTINILEYLNAGPGNIYSMKDLDGEKGYWVPEDNNGNSSWEFAAPSGTTINSNLLSWVTNADGNYKSNDNSYVNSPCLNISGFSRPLISMQYWIHTPINDGAVLQYSIDGGQQWNTLGSFANNVPTGQNWYNIVGLSSGPGNETRFGWSKNNMNNWSIAKHALNEIPGSRTKVRLRLAFASVNSVSEPTFEGFAFNNFKIEDRNRTILVENFTNLNANNAATNNANFRAFQSGLSETDIVKIQYHTTFPSEDVISTINVSDPNARAAFYGITQLNKAYIDGYSNGDFIGTWANQYFNLRTLNSAKVTINGTVSDADPELLSGQIVITAIESLPAEKYSLLIAVVEENVGTENHILRKMLPAASGTKVPALNKGASFPVTFSWIPDNRMINNGNNLKIIAFIQEIQNERDIIQSKLIDVPGLTPITGVEYLLPEDVIVYPSPASKEINVVLPFNVDSENRIFLIDQIGRMHDSGKIAAGTNTGRINVESLAEGVYILQLGNDKAGVIRKKVMIVHKN